MEDQLTTRDIVKSYRTAQNMTQGQFADALTKSLVNTGVGRVAVTHWEDEKKLKSPSTDFLLLCVVVYKDWRRAWAVDCLNVKLPEVFGDGIVKLPKVE
jgi:hypothetical protein